MAWITDAALKEAVANSMGQLPAELASRWDTLISEGNTAAYYLILRKLGERGYTVTEINSWAEKEIFNRKIGMLFALQEGGVLSTFSDTFIRSIDRRKELETALIINTSGVFVYPSGDGQETLSGPMDYTGYEFDPAIDFTFNDAMRQRPDTTL